MEIITAIWRHLSKLLILNLILVPFMVLAPAILVALPLLLIFDKPSGDFSGLAQLFIWTAPLSCAFWMLVSCHWQTVRRAQREGRLSTWREDAGGYGHTIPKAFGYMVLGLFGSFFTETVFMLLYRIPKGNPRGLALWFALLPFATFAPVILLWLRRWMRRRKQEDFISRAKTDRELRDQLRAASLYAKNLRSRNAH